MIIRGVDEVWSRRFPSVLAKKRFFQLCKAEEERLRLRKTGPGSSSPSSCWHGLLPPSNLNVRGRNCQLASGGRNDDDDNFESYESVSVRLRTIVSQELAKSLDYIASG